MYALLLHVALFDQPTLVTLMLIILILYTHLTHPKSSFNSTDSQTESWNPVSNEFIMGRAETK